MIAMRDIGETILNLPKNINLRIHPYLSIVYARMRSLLLSAKQHSVALLRRLERITKTDNVYLAKNGGLLLITQGVSVLNGFVLYILISHFLSKETYGQYKYLLSLFSLFGLTALTGIEASVERAVAHGHDGAVRAGFRRKFLGGACGSLIALLVAVYYQLHGRSDMAVALVLLAVFAPWIYAANVYITAFTGKKRFSDYTKLNIATTLLSFSVMALAFIYIHDPVLLFLAFLIASSSLLIAYRVAKTTLKNDSVGADTLRFGMHLSKLDILGTLANNIDSVLAFHFLGAASLAVYSFAILPVEQMKGFLKSVQSVAAPKFAITTISDLRQTLGRKLLIFMFGIAILMGIYILLVPAFFDLFFPAYRGSVAYSQIYSLSLIFAMPASLLQILFQSQGLRRETTIFNVVAYSTQIILLVLGVWFFGLWGLIGSRVLSRVLMFVNTVFLLKTHRPIQGEGPAPVL